jgi:hypothetical protein
VSERKKLRAIFHSGLEQIFIAEELKNPKYLLPNNSRI